MRSPLTFLLIWYVFLSLCLMWFHQCNWISLAPTELRWRTREKLRDQSCFEWCRCSFIKTCILYWKQCNVALWWPKKISSSHKVLDHKSDCCEFWPNFGCLGTLKLVKTLFCFFNTFFLFTTLLVKLLAWFNLGLPDHIRLKVAWWYGSSYADVLRIT